MKTRKRGPQCADRTGTAQECHTNLGVNLAQNDLHALFRSTARVLNEDSELLSMGDGHAGVGGVDLNDGAPAVVWMSRRRSKRGGVRCQRCDPLHSQQIHDATRVLHGDVKHILPQLQHAQFTVTRESAHNRAWWQQASHRAFGLEGVSKRLDLGHHGTTELWRRTQRVQAARRLLRRREAEWVRRRRRGGGGRRRASLADDVYIRHSGLQRERECEHVVGHGRRVEEHHRVALSARRRRMRARRRQHLRDCTGQLLPKLRVLLRQRIVHLLQALSLFLHATPTTP
jgi:hypothetical protein